MSHAATTVNEVSDTELEAILNTGTGATTVMVPDEKNKGEKKNFFSTKVDTKFIDNPGAGASETEEEEEEEEEEEGAAKATTTTTTAAAATTTTTATSTDTSFLNLDNEETTNEEEEEENSNGINTVPSKTSGLAKLTEAFIKKGLIVPFEGEEDLSKYKVKDHEDLWEMNLKKIKEDALEETQKNLFDSVSPQTRAVLEYELNGGRDLKSLFQALSASEQIQSLDISNEYGQEATVRAYLQAVNYGTPEEIQDEINAFKDRGDLEKKAKIMQPKLKGMQDAVINQRLENQARINQQRQEQSRLYQESIYKTIEKAELQGLKLNPNTQGLLYHGLTEANYPSAQGGNTNMLGHLLEKYQWMEPNHELIAEALWLLADRDGYHAQIKEGSKKTVEGKVLRTLKDAASDKKGSSSIVEEPENGKRQGIKRNPVGKNIFTRQG